MFVPFTVHCAYAHTRNFHYHYYAFIVCVCGNMLMLIHEGCSFDQSQCLYMKSKVCVSVCIQDMTSERGLNQSQHSWILMLKSSLSALFVNFRDLLPFFAIHAVASCWMMVDNTVINIMSGCYVCYSRNCVCAWNVRLQPLKSTGKHKH